MRDDCLERHWRELADVRQRPARPPRRRHGQGGWPAAHPLTRKLRAWILVGLTVLSGGTPALAGDLVFGHIAGHTGVQAVTAKGLRDGILLYFDQVNARGGVNGSRLVLQAID